MPIQPTKCRHDNMWAVFGTDLCLKHGGKIPATIAEYESVRDRLASMATIGYDGSMDNEPSPDEDREATLRLSPLIHKADLKDRIEEKLKDYREYGGSTIDYDAGLVRGLEIALQILDDEI